MLRPPRAQEQLPAGGQHLRRVRQGVGAGRLRREEGSRVAGVLLLRWRLVVVVVLRLVQVVQLVVGRAESEGRGALLLPQVLGPERGSRPRVLPGVRGSHGVRVSAEPREACHALRGRMMMMMVVVVVGVSPRCQVN